MILIDHWEIQLLFVKRDPTKRDIKPKSLLSFIYRFLAHNNLSIRKGTHIGQQLPTNSLGFVYSFLRTIIQNRKLYNIEPEFIINMDETAINYNMPPNTTVNKIGAKIIFIKTQRQEKARISVILAICGDVVKLQPYIIFKGAKKGNIYKKLLKNELVKKNKFFITCNCNAWSNKEIIKDWVNNVYIKYFKGKTELKRTLLVLDHESMHDNFEILKFLFDNKN